MRYARQEIFKEIGKEGQLRLSKSTAAIVGLGALGSVSAELLTRAGIGKLILIDRDTVELSNLQRQSLFNENDIGKAKASQAKEHLSKINSRVKIYFFIDDLNFENIEKILSEKNKIGLILDCTDNMDTRFLINDFCVKNKIPFIYSSAIGSKGYVFNAIPDENRPCLRCFLREAAQLETCETAGVLNTITHIIASLQTTEALKILLKKSNSGKKLLFFDVWKNELLKIKANKNKNCICCANKIFEYLNGKKSPRVVKLCGNGIYQVNAKTIDRGQFNHLKSRLKKIGKVIDFGYCINFDDRLTVFRNGRVLVKAKNENEAKSLYSKFVGN